MKGLFFQARLSLKFPSTFVVVLLIRDTAECHLIKVVTVRKLLISAAKMTQLWLGVVQHLARWNPFLISPLQLVCLREHLYKIWEIYRIFLPCSRYLNPLLTVNCVASMLWMTHVQSHWARTHCQKRKGVNQIMRRLVLRKVCKLFSNTRAVIE